MGLNDASTGSLRLKNLSADIVFRHDVIDN